MFGFVTMPAQLKYDADSPVGSSDYPYKLIIIGGGPSGCSVIVRAARTNTLDQLCKADESQQLAGVCLIDQCSIDRFGGGRLQDYAINSNTFANKFASNVLDDKADTLPPESCTNSCFEKLKLTSNCKQLHEYGSKQGSLKVVGQFLCDVGRSVAETLALYPTASSCLTNTSVDAVQRYQRSDGLIGWRLSITEVGGKRFIYGKDVLFATGDIPFSFPFSFFLFLFLSHSFDHFHYISFCQSFCLYAFMFVFICVCMYGCMYVCLSVCLSFCFSLLYL